MGQSRLILSVVGTFGHNSARLHFHPDQQAFLGGWVRCWVNCVCWDKGGWPDDGGLRGLWLLWQVLLLWQVNVCVQVRTWIGWFVFSNLSEREF